MAGRFTEEKYEMGVAEEERLYPILKNFFGATLKRSRYSKARVDFYDTDKLVEMKSRKGSSYRYKTTWITVDKGDINTTRDIYFVFNFTDKLMCIKFDREKFSHYNQSVNEWGVSNWDVPIEDLTFIARNEKDIRGTCFL